MSRTVVEHADGQLTIEPAATGSLLRIHARPGVFVPDDRWVTRYSEALIGEVLSTKGLAYLIDEIRREEDPTCIEHALRLDLLSFVPEAAFSRRRILDFGCGSGASTMVLSRMFPTAEIVGVELDERKLSTARRRAEFYGVQDRVTFHASPTPTSLPAGIGHFDHVLFCAVFEHLLPDERPEMLSMLWSHLLAGGHLFLNDTPYRWLPIETHTTSLPLINYLPSSLAFAYARRFSSRVPRNASNAELLRLGIRGGSLGEVRRILQRVGARVEPVLPSRNGVRGYVDLWAGHSVIARGAARTRVLSTALRAVQTLTGAVATPTLSAAFRKLG